jgi:hypothetical protein
VETEHGKLPPPPGLIASLAAGFDSVANSITVIALPVLFDLFLWFGPHLRLRDLLQPWIEQLPSFYSSLTSAANLEAVQQFWIELADRFNLFIGLRTFPVGTSSLLTFEMPVQTPFGSPPVFEAGSVFGILGWGALAVLTGWLIGALYYYWVSKVSLRPESLPLWKSLVQAVFLSLIWLVLMFSVGMPVMTFLSLTTLISPALGQIALFAAGLVSLWLVVPVYFSAHGIFTYQMDALKAILNSLRMVRFTLPTTFLFLLLLTVIGQGLRFLWSTPPQDSWWLLVGILGHAFVSTALLSASFIYYRDVNNWLKVVFEQLKMQTNSVKV